jgi:hypothetical protein
VAQHVQARAIGQAHVGDHGVEGVFIKRQAGVIDTASRFNMVPLAQ